MIGERIIKLREKRGWSQRELANRAGLNFSVMNRIEIGKRTVTDQVITVFADLFDVSTDYLLGRNEKPLSDLATDEKEMMEFIKDPNLNLFFKEMKEAPEDQLEEIRQIWEVIKKRGQNK
ncbi:helix-turn-helix transcriptional regulator [Bacillus sp. 37MA]|uniref:helix-turn-helix domain-containing protein n=1 Tax=Bacillus sp. 37MA TaxID=1132442 RepID=UPI0003621321|nr:helix-turn-helix transcriptional regulator [Bacillus sp. 37MA]